MVAIKKVSVSTSLISQSQIESKVRGITINQATSFNDNDAAPTALEYLFISLAGCLISTAQIIMQQRQIKLQHIDVKIDGELDEEVWKGENTDNRAGFKYIQIQINLKSKLSVVETKELLSEIDRRCPILDNLQNMSIVDVMKV